MLGAPHILVSSSKNLPKIHSRFTEDLPKIRPFYTYPKLTEDLPKIYPKFTKDLPKTSKFTEDLPNIYQRFTKISCWDSLFSAADT